jgi:hypothetical protein
MSSRVKGRKLKPMGFSADMALLEREKDPTRRV